MTPTFKTSAKDDVSLSQSMQPVNNLQVISQQEVLGKDFKVYGDFENPLFLAKDVAEWIDYAKRPDGSFQVSHMIANVDDEEKIKLTSTVNNPNGWSESWFLTENGLYEVLMLSRKPIAKTFKKEVKKILKEIRKTGKYIAPTVPTKSQAEIDLENLRARTHDKEIELERARFLRSVSLSYAGKSDTYRQVLDAYAVHEVVGAFALPLPEIRQRLMSATEVGKVLGISANKVGSIATRNNLKTEENGSWVRDKSRYSAKEVDTFRYNEHGLERLRQLLEQSKEESDD